MQNNISLRRAIWIWLLAALFFLFEFFLRAFPNTLHNDLVASFRLTGAEFALIGGMYYLAYSFLQIPAGYIFDRLGSKFTMTLACSICALGAIVFLISNIYPVGLIGRLLMGIGSAFGFIGLLTISVRYFDHKYLGFLSGATQILGAVGPILAATPLLMLTNYLHHWQYALLLVAVFGFMLSFLLWCSIPNNQNHQRHEKAHSGNLLQTLVKSPTQWLISLYAFLIMQQFPLLV